MTRFFSKKSLLTLFYHKMMFVESWKIQGVTAEKMLFLLARVITMLMLEVMK